MVDFAPCFDQRFSHEVNAKEEYECSYDHDRNITNNNRASNEDAKGSKSEHNARHSTVSSAADEKDCICVYKVILGINQIFDKTILQNSMTDLNTAK